MRKRLFTVVPLENGAKIRVFVSQNRYSFAYSYRFTGGSDRIIAISSDAMSKAEIHSMVKAKGRNL